MIIQMMKLPEETKTADKSNNPDENGKVIIIKMEPYKPKLSIFKATLCSQLPGDVGQEDSEAPIWFQSMSHQSLLQMSAKLLKLQVVV